MDRCDSCGQYIYHGDFKKGATRELLDKSNPYNPKNYEIICIKCNKINKEAS